MSLPVRRSSLTHVTMITIMSARTSDDFDAVRTDNGSIRAARIIVKENASDLHLSTRVRHSA